MTTNVRYTCSYPPSGESGGSSDPDKAILLRSWKRMVSNETVLSVLFSSDLPSRKLVYVSTTDTVLDTLKALKNNNILCVLMMDPKINQVPGLIDILDLTTYIARKCLGTNTANKPEDRRLFINELFGQSIEPLFNVSERNLWFAVYDNSPFEVLFQYLSMQDLKRMIVFDHEDSTKVVGILTQFDVIRWLNDNWKKQLKMEDVISDEKLMVREIWNRKMKGGENKDLVMVSLDDKLVNVWELLYDKKISAVPVVERGGSKLVGTISASDLRILADHPDKILDILQMSCREFMNKYQAGLQGRGNRVNCTCKVEENIFLVIHRIVDAKVHRAWIVNDKEEVIGVLSLCDIIDGFNHLNQ